VGIKERYSRLRPLPPDISRRLEALPAVLAGHPLRLAYLFGSAARDPATASDVDLAVLPADGFSYPGLYADLSTALGTDRLDLADLRCASVLLQWEAVTTGRLLLAASPAEAAAYERLVRARYRDHRLRWGHRKTISGGGAMAIRRDFIHESLADLDQVAAELEKYASVTAQAMARDLSLRWTVERGLLAGLTILFTVCEHILAAHFRRYPETYEGLLQELHHAGVLPPALYERLKGSGGFRNVLVHEYVRVDLEQLAAALRGAPATFREFARAVEEWLAGVPE